MHHTEAQLRNAAVLHLEGIPDRTRRLFPVQISVTTPNGLTTSKFIRPLSSWTPLSDRHAEIYKASMEHGIDGANVVRWLDRNLSEHLVLSDSSVTTQPMLDRLFDAFDQARMIRLRDYWPAMYMAAADKHIDRDDVDALLLTLFDASQDSMHNRTSRKAGVLDLILSRGSEMVLA